jgi:hypothetical protein
VNLAEAVQVRFWRVQGDCTWRNIAERWVAVFGEDELADEFLPGWAGNQLAGMELHERAMAALGETFE